MRIQLSRVVLALGILTLTTARLAAEGPAPAAPRGVIAGKILDAATGDPIIEAGVEVVQTGQRVRTDLDGKFELKVAPGAYELRIFAPLYQGTRLQQVQVRPDAVTRADAKLAPEGQAGVEVVEVVAKADKAAEAVVLLERKTSLTISDNIAAETISKSPDSDASEVVERVPGVTISDDKFVIVRGLGERYSSALLNGSRLPSTDPTRRVVPLDLFPANFIESLSIVKAFTPDLPGDFAGGLVDIRLKDYPDELTATISLDTAATTQTTFSKYDTYHGSNVDYLGFGSGYRALPGFYPDKFVPRIPPPAQSREYASKLHNVWDVDSQSAAPNTGINFTLGNRFGPFGIGFGGLYKTSYEHHPTEVNRVVNQKGAAIPGQGESIPYVSSDFIGDRSLFETQLGGVLTAEYQLDDHNEFHFRGLVNHTSADDVVTKQGTSENTGTDTDIYAQTFQYTEQHLGFMQLAGTHQWDAIRTDWRTVYADTTQDIPDRRQLRYLSVDGGPYALDPAGSEAPLRTFQGLHEYLTDSALDITVPFKTALPRTDVWSGLPANLKFGAAYAFRRRPVHYRRFIYEALNTQGLDLTQQPEALLQASNVGNYFRFVEDTRPDDAFRATQEIAAGYGMLELPLIADTLRAVGGVRTEYSYITAQSRKTSIINNLDPLPVASLIYNPRDDMNVRVGYSHTVSRPEFRELTPSTYIVEEGQLIVVGNPQLKSAEIDSYDLRWEWFYSPLELVSISAFYKDLKNPIEETIISGGDKPLQTFANAPTGYLVGAEFEARKQFDFLVGPLERVHGLERVAQYARNLSLTGNFAYIDSQAEFDPPRTDTVADIITNRKHALQGQAPYVVNTALEYEWADGSARLLYNTAGRSISLVGFSRIPDAHLEQRHELDFVAVSKAQPFGTPVTLKFGVENILNDAYKETQADFVTYRYRSGVTFSFGVSYAY